MSLKVYEAIKAVMKDLSADGISKSRSNQQQGYKFRGIDDVYNALSAALSKNGLLMLPRILSREVQERTTKNGTALFYVTVEAEFDLVCAEDGSTHVIRTFGEAQDSADKATNKAMSAAYKYAAFQAFCIPTEGDNDADATTHDVAGRNAAPPKPAPAKWMRDMESKIAGAESVEKINEIRAYINGKILPEAQAKKLTTACSNAESALHAGAH